MSKYSEEDGYEQLDRDVEGNGNVLTVAMGDLRECQGQGRLGKWVVEAIDGSLRRRGLAYQGDLELDQMEDRPRVQAGHHRRTADRSSYPVPSEPGH